MNQKELRKMVIGNNLSSNILLTIKIAFELSVQIQAVYLISRLVEHNITLTGSKVIFVTMAAGVILKALFNYLHVKLAHERAYSKLTELRLKILEHFDRLNLGFFKEHSTGELTNIIENDVEKVEVYLAHGLSEIMSATLIPALIFIFMLFVDYRLALLMTSGLPLMFLTQFLSKETMKKTMNKYFFHENKMREEMMEYTKNIAVIKAFSKEEEISERTLKTAKEYVYWVKKSMGGITVPMGLIDVFMELGTVLVMIAGSIALVKGEIDITQFILSIVMSSVFIMQVSKTATLHHFSIVFNEALKSIGKVMNAKTVDNKNEEGLQAGDIEFKNVNFNYGRNSFKLKDINLLIKEKSLNAFVGASGCGKTTIANLLMGFWDPTDGLITIGGKDISQYNNKSISSLIASVSQDVVLFNISIFDNIAIGKDGAKREEVIEAAKKARCHDFISRLPNGYDTRVGEMGVKLSGGEKQRISIARMILKNAPILILDEAMAAVDSENERLITEAIDDLRKDKTLITIAHHLNTITQSDQIIVIDKGMIAARGTDEELLSNCPLYADMVSAQNKVDSWKLRQEA
ncbi:ABC transporter ATP-binding protein [Candidatus Fermentibacteria bacterium]|nr:MAG: ABC transporter ATP-binding protein [Candidatus Fermentibacteria bacterium]